MPRLPLFLSLLATSGLTAAELQVITLKTLTAQMRFDQTEFSVSPGAEVKVVLENTDDMPHNVAIFQPGTDVVAVSNKNVEDPTAVKRDWLPTDPRMIAHSKMVGPKSRDEFTFKAPDKPGVYPYVCTFPGHAGSMQGKMHVTAPCPGLTGTTYAVYLGDWTKLPDFTALKPQSEGTFADNLIRTEFGEMKKGFGAVYTGKLKAPKDGDYTFHLTSDDGARILVDGKKVVEYDGIHPAGDVKEGKVKLKAGEHTFRLEYFQGAGEIELFAAWSGPGFSPTVFTKWAPEGWDGKPAKKKKPDAPSLPLVVGTEPVIYRNFITKSGGRPFAVGYPGGFNLTWSADQMNLALVWRGAFIDAGRHWTDRGGGETSPMGYDVLRPTVDVGPPFAVLSSLNSEWPKSDKAQRPRDYQWQGYTLDNKRVPAFAYAWNGVAVTDRFDAEGDATGSGRLVRTLKLSGPIPANSYLRVAQGTIKAAKSTYLVDGGNFDIQGRTFDNKMDVSVEGAQIAGQNLLVPARPEIVLIYTWTTSHADHAAPNHGHGQ